MQQLLRCAVVAALVMPGLAADTKITTARHTDASTMMGQENPARDSTRTTWIGKDRMRVEEGDTITIVRTDLKKMFVLHQQDKTYSALELPIDLKKHLPPPAAASMEGMVASAKVTLTPTTETKKIKGWNATKYTMTTTMEMPMPVTITQNMWVTKDVTVDNAAFIDLHAGMMAFAPFLSPMMTESKKIDGFPVLSETTTLAMGGETKSREEVTAVEIKDAPADAYEVPKDFKKKPYDFTTDNPNGGGPPRPPTGNLPGEKPVEPRKNPPTPPK